MKFLHLAPLLAGLAATNPASASDLPSAPAPAGQADIAVAPTLTPAQLEELVGPIALYPDALLALILPASTQPTDIVLAARDLRDRPNDLSQVEHRAWDDSVKSLTRYPEVLQWLDQNLAWTQQLGEAFTAQPAEVMNAVQRLRTKARAAGTLRDSSQQRVLTESETIRIVPAQPDVIYVPRYEPAVVFVDRPAYVSRPFITYSIGYSVGSWLAYDCDWRHRRIWVGDRHRTWHRHDWHRPLAPVHVTHVHRESWRPWQPRTRSSVTIVTHRPPPQVVVHRPANSSHRPPTTYHRPPTTYHRPHVPPQIHHRPQVQPTAVPRVHVNVPPPAERTARPSHEYHDRSREAFRRAPHPVSSQPGATPAPSFSSPVVISPPVPSVHHRAHNIAASMHARGAFNPPAAAMPQPVSAPISAPAPAPEPASHAAPAFVPPASAPAAAEPTVTHDVQQSARGGRGRLLR